MPACVPILLLRLPQTAARKPPEQHVVVGAFQLVERRQQLLLIARTECRRLPVDEDGPVREARRHASVLYGASEPDAAQPRIECHDRTRS